MSVSAGQTTNLGTVTWTPLRVGPTVFELGYPDRKASEFRHGEDFWAPAGTPVPGYPLPIWGAQVYFPLDFPNGMTYTVGQSKWDTDWNYVMPSLPDAAGGFQPCTGKINFNLAATPASGAQASIYLAAAGDDGGNIAVSINGVNLGAANGVTATPNPLAILGFNTPSGYGDDSSIHFSDHGPFWDEQIKFPASLLQAGTNTITIQMNGENLVDYLMVDYLRLEVTGYVPPPPASVTAYPGNNNVLVTWPVIPGSASYTISRSTSATGTFTSIHSGLLGPVSGSDSTISTYNDTSAVDGTTYYYEVSSSNPQNGSSANSSSSNAVTPAMGLSSSAPAAPSALQITGTGDRSASLSWTASSGANYYALSRTTMYPDGTGGTYALRTIVLNDHLTGTTFTDTTPTDGKIYNYFVQAVSAGGTSIASNSVTATPLSTAVPSGAPIQLTGSRDSTGTIITLNWAPVAGATGYVIYRSTSANGPFVFSTNFVNATPQTNYVDKTLSASTVYYYQVTAVNTAGISTAASLTVPTSSLNPVVSSVSVTAPVGGTFSYAISATNSPTSYNAIGLPSGLSINTMTGLITGTLGATQTATITLIATNSSGSGSGTLALTINNQPAITSSLTASAQLNTPFSYTITTVNNPNTINAAGLPAGLSFNAATDVISGTPTSAGTSNVTITASNSSGTETVTLVLSVIPPQPVITSATTDTAATGYLFGYAIIATNSPTSYAATNLPSELTLNTTTGIISGSFSSTGSYTIGISATNAGGTATSTLTLTVVPLSNIPLKWTGTSSLVWDTVTSNWVNGTASATYLEADAVTFDDTGSGGTITLAGAFSPASLTVSNSSKSYQFNGPGSLNGSMSLTKSGTASLSIAEANTYTGGTQVLGGQLYLSGSSMALGTGTLTLGSSGDTTTVVVRADSINLANSISVYAGGTRWLEPGNGNAVTYTGPVVLNGGATVGLSTIGGNITLSGGVTGNGNILLGENGGERGNSETLSGAALNNTGTISDAGNPDTGGAFISAAVGTNVTGITQNSSTESMTLTGANSFYGPITITTGTFTLGGAGVLGSGSSMGSIADNGTFAFNSTSAQTLGGMISGSGSLLLTGTGTLSLTASSSFTGTTAVSAGALLISGSIAGPVTVSSGATLEGTGTIGSVTINGGGKINLRDGTIGTLTMGGLSTGNASTPSAFSFDIQTSAGTTTVDKIVDTGMLTLNGLSGTTITIGNLSGTSTLTNGASAYPLLTYTGTQQTLGDLVLSTTSLDGKTLSLSQTGDTIYLDIKIPATVTLGNLAATYNGSPQAATATTNPSGLNVAFTYNGSGTTPINAGTFTVIGTINDPNYGGSTIGTLVISQAPATVTLGNLAAAYNGSPQAATATTAPSGLGVTFTYNGSGTAPTNAGSYTVIGTISDPNYQGMGTGTLVISQAADMATDTPTLPRWALFLLASLLIYLAARDKKLFVR